MMKDLEARIEALIADLGCDDGIHCRKARQALVKIGARSIPALTRASASSSQMVRWEAIKALSQINGLASIKALISHLSDDDSGIVWMAADGLSRQGKKAVIPVLEALISNASSNRLRDGVHHFLIDVTRGGGSDKSIYESVITSLEVPEARLTSPVAAQIALGKIRAH